jgi:hypothetical protein
VHADRHARAAGGARNRGAGIGVADGYNYDGHSLLTNESGTLDGYVYIDEGNNSG